LVRDAKEHGVIVLPVDVNHSRWDCTSQPELRLGFRMLSGFSHDWAVTIETARRSEPFRSMDDFVQRTGLRRSAVKRLAEADAFRSMGSDRRRALWEALGQEKRPRRLPLFEKPSPQEAIPDLPKLEACEEVFADYRTTGLSLRAHPISFYREQLNRLGIQCAAELADIPNNRSVRVAGLVLLRQRPSTAKGITFVTLEDETGVANLVVHQRTWERFYQIAKRSPAWIAHGRVESKQSVIHVVVNRLEDLPQRLTHLRVESRNFR
jgi:error-prone DNA polymerase